MRQSTRSRVSTKCATIATTIRSTKLKGTPKIDPAPKPQWPMPGTIRAVRTPSSSLRRRTYSSGPCRIDRLSHRNDRIGPALEEDQLPATVLNFSTSPVTAPLSTGPSAASTLPYRDSASNVRQSQLGPNTHLKRPSNFESPGALPGASKEAPVEDPPRCRAARRRRAACRSCRRAQVIAFTVRPARGSGNRRPRRPCRLTPRDRNRRPTDRR